MTLRCVIGFGLLLITAALWPSDLVPITDVEPTVATARVSVNPDDPAIWLHPDDPSRSLVLGTNKTATPKGALVVFGLDGRMVQKLGGINRPNNVDVEYGMMLQGGPADIAVVTERNSRRLRVFRISPQEPRLQEISSEEGLPVFAGERGKRSWPMGVALYRRGHDGAIFAILSRKKGPRNDYLWQYRLQDDGTGRVQATKVREFGRFSGRGQIEAIAVDDALGHIYYADEKGGIRKWHADPDHPDADRELAYFGRRGFSGQREGIAIYARSDGTGYIICTDQLKQNSQYSQYRIYTREGEPGRPHDHSRLLKVIRGGADETDGIDVTSVYLGSQFPNGLFVAMNNRGRNFLLYRWDDIATAGYPKLRAGFSALPPHASLLDRP